MLLGLGTKGSLGLGPQAQGQWGRLAEARATQAPGAQAFAADPYRALVGVRAAPRRTAPPHLRVVPAEQQGHGRGHKEWGALCSTPAAHCAPGLHAARGCLHPSREPGMLWEQGTKM